MIWKIALAMLATALLSAGIVYGLRGDHCEKQPADCVNVLDATVIDGGGQ